MRVGTKYRLSDISSHHLIISLKVFLVTLLPILSPDHALNVIKYLAVSSSHTFRVGVLVDGHLSGQEGFGLADANVHQVAVVLHTLHTAAECLPDEQRGEINLRETHRDPCRVRTLTTHHASLCDTKKDSLAANIYIFFYLFFFILRIYFHFDALFMKS